MPPAVANGLADTVLNLAYPWAYAYDIVYWKMILDLQDALIDSQTIICH